MNSKQPTQIRPRQGCCLTLLSITFINPEEYNSDLDTAILLVKQVEIVNQKLQDKKTQAMCYFVYSNALREGRKSEEGKQYIEKSLAVYKTISEPSAMAEAWLELSKYYSSYDDESLKKRKQCFERALPLYQAA